VALGRLEQEVCTDLGGGYLLQDRVDGAITLEV
jgi:hypothetical protein